MPRTPRGHKRPADTIANAVLVMKIATGEIQEEGTTKQTDASAAALGSKGGRARAATLSRTKRKKIAQAAAAARWSERGKRR